MKALTFSTILLILTGLIACNSGSDENQTETGEQNSSTQQQPQIQQQKSEINYNFRLEMQDLLVHYFELKSAITQTDMEAASTAAGQLSAFSSSVLDNVLGAENRGLWLGIARIIRTEADKLIETESEEEMRIYFEHISRSMIRIVDSFDPIGGPYFIMECEEAATGENQWLSPNEEISNPYQTNADEACGEIVEEL